MCSAAIVSDFIHRVWIFLGKTQATELLPQNTDNACATVRASKPSYSKDRGPVYRVAFRIIMAQSSTSGTGTCSLGSCIQFNMKTPCFFIQTK